MVRKAVTHVTAVLVSLALVIASSQNQSVALAADAATPTQTAPMSQSDLRGLVAPIALYPDNLVAEVLAPATFPDQVAIANPCRALIDGEVPGYVPVVRGGGRMHVRMLCLGRHWNGETYT